jgi:hypothetical protein
MTNRKYDRQQSATSSKNAVWLSFDLGIQGDYEGFYTWLDSKAARECGDSLAFLNYEHEGELPEDLRADLERAVKFGSRSRIYAIYLDPTSKKMKGKFLYGKRKSPPWTGYGPQGGDEEDSV